MPARSAPITVKMNAQLLQEARIAARNAGIPVTQFCSEVLENEIATRRCRALPSQVVCDPPEDSNWKRLRGVALDDLSGPLNSHALHLPRRG